MDQKEISRKLRELYPIKPAPELKPGESYTYGLDPSVSFSKKDLSIRNVDKIPEIIFEADPKKLWMTNCPGIDLSRFPNVELLNISKMDPNLIELNRPFSSLKTVFLSEIDDAFPEWLHHCPNVEELWICKSKISQLPDWVAELPIKHLRLKHLLMKDLPEWLPQLPLRKLEIEDLPLGKIPEVYRNWKYSIIRLPNCRINKIPDWVGDMTWLKIISLSNNSISDVPRFLFEKLKLRGVNLSHNRIRELPEGVWADQSFGKLDLSHNQIRDLPADFGEMEIDILRLNHNPIEELPHFKNIQRQILDLSQTNLQYPMFWKQDHTWLKKMSKVIVPDWWDKEMIYAARRLIGFPKYPIYTYTEYLEYSRLRHG